MSDAYICYIFALIQFVFTAYFLLVKDSIVPQFGKSSLFGDMRFIADDSAAKKQKKVSAIGNRQQPCYVM